MPLPLILSDLPPLVEQPSDSIATAVEGEQIFTARQGNSRPLEASFLAQVSQLSKAARKEEGRDPQKSAYAVLSNWLETQGERATTGNGVDLPTEFTAPVTYDAGLWTANDAEPGQNPMGEVQKPSYPFDSYPFDNVEPAPSERNSGAPETLEDEAPDSEDGGPDVEVETPEILEDGSSEPLRPDQVTELILRADRQSYDPIQQIITASGDVLVQIGNAQLAAEQIWVNLENRYLRAEGDVFFNRNEQILEGETATYNLLQGSGEITDARGELSLETVSSDLASIPFANETFGPTPLDYRLEQTGSISSVTSAGGLTLGTDADRDIFGGEDGGISRIRFESDVIYFDADGWYAEELRLTNDPFSPPEIELRGNSVSLVPLNEEEAELYIENPRLVFDQGFTVPLFKERYLIQRGQIATDEINPLPTGVGVDGRDRDGLFIERELDLETNSPLQLTVVPQFYIGRWLNDSDYDLFDPSNFGVVARLNGPLGPRISATGLVSVPGLDLENFSDRLRASIRTQQLIGDHRLSLEYSYRDRLFNGSLGFQDVQTSLGVLLQSPRIELGDTKIALTYQASGQYVTADTDRADLLASGESRGLASLFRFQGAVDLGRRFTLWRGEPLPATPTEGLRYSPIPVVPFLSLRVGLRGVATYYTNDVLQENLEARLSLSGQIGHLSRNYFDYTQFNLGYSKSFVGGEDSPFLFDRSVDRNVLSGGIIQQIYGPILVGFQTSLNLDSGDDIDTDIILEYRRRAYGVLLQYSPSRDTGFIGFRISDFDWTGRPRPFDADDTELGTGEESVIVE
jgi:hypothetical protein